ncbi:hypothetical protein KJ567_01830, partial [Candidatus Bipolaricaulota bacterium]|nr:hypothetical protein [Candidatus Bipolaricaulota bacterium]
MAIANDKALRDLEFDRLKRLVQGYASCSLGEEAVSALVPLADREAIERSIEEVTQAIVFLGREGRFSLGGVRDLAPLLERAKESAFLDGEEFLTVLHTIEGTLQIRDALTQEAELSPLRGLAERLTAGEDRIRREIARVLDEHGSVRDDASPQLGKLLAGRRTLDSRVEAKLRALIDRNPELISEPIITRRGGRLVVPIRSGAVGAMDFVVHGRSATGQTLYAEPTSLVPDNNALAGMEEEIRSEIRRILRQLTDEFVSAESAFLRDRAVLGHIDSLFARAGYAIAHRCAFPILGERLVLKDARHPLLARETVVPVSLSLGEDARIVVITGPNTGGKTVTLKTLGLQVLMVQSGIPIPASPDSELTIVSRVRTDIGDEQSIEQNLSTFSGHMSNIVSLLEEADERSLILLDELGAGTEPQEGAALGLSIIEALIESDSLVGVSTHLTPLKYFAIRHPKIKTAAMEFDLQTLSPTYRVIEGIPGRSNAFVIAQRLGLPAERIERARSFLSQGEIRAEDILDELERERQAMRRHRENAEQDRVLAKNAREEYEGKLASFEQERVSALSERFKALDQFLRDGQRRVEDVLAAAKSGAAEDETRAGLHEIAALRQALETQRQEIPLRSDQATLSPDALEVGQLVHVRSVAADGRIVHIGAQGKLTVDLDG